MKNYFLSLFNEENRLKTTSFLATTALLVKKTEYISEAVVMTIIFLFCLPGILTGIIGTLIYAFRKK